MKQLWQIKDLLQGYIVIVKPVVLVKTTTTTFFCTHSCSKKKKDYSQIFCVHFRQVNVMMSNVLVPCRASTSHCLFSGAKFFSMLHQASGYWQISMEPAGSGILPLWLHQYCMIGPLCPWFLPHHKHRTMERVMELTLSGHRFETSLIYLVDVTVFMRKSL